MYIIERCTVSETNGVLFVVYQKRIKTIVLLKKR
ncbi:hypothetical protein SAMN05421821_101229 [Mucilaginibacter lappiensis]|uniref:Uncharacterized protein n=1 Tax=Mucilaginibacter lappiensis TaxID=354630 RepID=A0ABR6PDL5_9SPHI|nr:hypothetical protein [Mucilaginibacter lappiensis]SIP94737.1 hypothetical protein SAMN05421821_101229 [Mucilaginibacter lappiensis]